MSWETELFDASFRGVPFETTATAKDVTRSQAVYQVPYADTSTHEDMGAQPQRLSITAIISGDNALAELLALEDALDTAGVGELVHPIYGSLQVSVVSYQVSTDVNPDQHVVSIVFLRKDTAIDPALFDLSIPSDETPVVDLLTDEIIAGVSAEYEAIEATDPTTALTWIDQMTGHINSVRDYLGSAQRLLNKITSPPVWAAQLLDAVDDAWAAIPNLDSPMAQWRNINDRIKLWGQRFDLSGSNPIATRLSAVASRTSAPAVGLLAIRVLTSELEKQTETINPLQLAELRNEVRTTLQRSIDNERQSPSVGSARRINYTKQLALQVQQLTEQLLNRQPPLIQKATPVPLCPRLLAHYLYGDHTRARQIVLLNPTLKNPALIDQGVMLNVYAE